MISTRFNRDCPAPQFDSNEFAVRIIDDSDYGIDSVYVSQSTEILLDQNWRSDTFATHSNRRSQCYYVFQKTYKVGTETRNYTRLRIASAKSLATSAVLEYIDAREASGKYTYSIDLVPYMTIRLELWAHFQTEAEEGDKIRVRVVNETGSDLKDVEYILEGNTLGIPFLAAGDSTDYFEIEPTYRIPVISMVIGADTIYQESTLDFPASPPYLEPGRYVSRIDTVQAWNLRELGTYVRDE